MVMTSKARTNIYFLPSNALGVAAFTADSGSIDIELKWDGEKTGVTQENLT